MEENMNNIKNLSNDDLLSLHASVLEHLNYLEGQILSLEEEISQEGNQEEKTEENGGDDNE